ncbi:MAG: sodium:proton antiporter [Gammaproteobacteria bacterium SG8_47]|nr:MAG: sodium:proton antiporter [Gammaproteobacteria bacterium SG8_47]
MLTALREFLKMESASGILLVAAAILAMVVNNSPLSSLYDHLLSMPVEIRVGAVHIDKPLLLWINDGLMAVFFFLVGLEIKREVLEGELSNPAQIALPAFGAVGGMAVPALVYVALNWGDDTAMNGWAIPAATDIAFALGVLSLLGNRVPAALKVFLLTLAILDDLGAIVIIALFYSGDLSLSSLAIAASAVVVLAVLNRRGVVSIAPYALVGVVLWAAVLKSGVHATLAGVLLALFIPLRVGDKAERAPLRQLEHDLHPSVAFVILPIFAFANGGVDLAGVSLDMLTHPIPLGIALGLFVGKQLGVFTFAWLAIKLGVARLPKGVNYIQVYAVSVLCGVGFTMSLFIASLAFEHSRQNVMVDERIGILVGSLISAAVGYLILRVSSRNAAPASS